MTKCRASTTIARSISMNAPVALYGSIGRLMNRPKYEATAQVNERPTMWALRFRNASTPHAEAARNRSANMTALTGTHHVSR